MVRQLIFLSAVGCAEPSWRNADLQLDIVGAGLQDDDRVRICIDGVRIQEAAVKSGRIAVSQLPPEGPLYISVDHIVDDESHGSIDPITLDEEKPWAEVEWIACPDVCVPCTQSTSAPEQQVDSQRYLAVRFVE